MIDPRGVLEDFGVRPPPETRLKVWDSTAETRFMVLPMRPMGSDDLDEAQVAALVARDAMVGAGLASMPERGR